MVQFGLFRTNTFDLFEWRIVFENQFSSILSKRPFLEFWPPRLIFRSSQIQSSQSELIQFSAASDKNGSQLDYPDSWNANRLFKMTLSPRWTQSYLQTFQMQRFSIKQCLLNTTAAQLSSFLPPIPETELMRRFRQKKSYSLPKPPDNAKIVWHSLKQTPWT